jgi:hypothetical protein
VKKLAKECRECIWAALFVLILIALACISWAIALGGGNPYHSRDVHVFDVNGFEQASFQRGSWVYVRRYMCIDRDTLTEQAPALFDLSRHALVPLFGSQVVAKKGCSERGFGFQIPPSLPPGPYEYRNVSRYQDNLIGRDESNIYPPIKIEVLP